MNDNERDELLSGQFVRTPELIMQTQRHLGCSVFSCLHFIWIKTGGWGKNEDTLSYSQFANDSRYGSGLSIKTIQRSVEKLAEMELITMTPSFNNMNEYSLNIDKIKQLVRQPYETKSRAKRTICPKDSRDNKSNNMDNLSISRDNLGEKGGQNVTHTRNVTQEPLHNNTKTISENQKPKTFKPEKPEGVSEQTWSDLLTLRKKKRAVESQTAWNSIFNALEKTQQATGHSFEQMIVEWVTADWKGFKFDWYMNRTKSNNQLAANNQTQGANYGQQQSELSHFDKLRAEAAAKYGNQQSESNAIRTVNQYDY